MCTTSTTACVCKLLTMAPASIPIPRPYRQAISVSASCASAPTRFPLSSASSADAEPEQQSTSSGRTRRTLRVNFQPSTDDRIRVFIVDDHEMVRSGLATFLRVVSDLELVGEAASGEEGVQLCEQIQPDVVLMDMVLPGMDGVAATREVRARCPQTRVVALTSFPEEDLVQRALEAGATGYLLKNVGARELVSAIRAA